MPLHVGEQGYDDLGDNYKSGGGGGGPIGSSPLGPGGLAIGGGGGFFGSGMNALGSNPYFQKRLMAMNGGFQSPMGQPQMGNFQALASQPRSEMGAYSMQPQGQMAVNPLANSSNPWFRHAGAVANQNPVLRNPQAGYNSPGADPHTIGAVGGQLGTGTAGPNTLNNLLQMLLSGQTLPGTVFSPYGSAAAQEARRQGADQTALALQQRAKLAQLYNGGLDPSQRGYGDFWSQMGIQGGLAKSLNDYNSQSAQSYDDMLRQLFAQALGFNYNQSGEEQAFRHNKQLQNQGQGGGLGGLFGGLLGSALGPIGAAAGGAAGNAIFGRK